MTLKVSMVDSSFTNTSEIQRKSLYQNHGMIKNLRDVLLLQDREMNAPAGLQIVLVPRGARRGW